MRKIYNIIKEDKVFYLAVAVMSLFIIFALGNLQTLDHTTSEMVQILSKDFGWFYILAVGSFIILSIYLIFSPYRNITLGKDGEKSKYSFASWFSMLFSAGMGIGLVFWGVAEPLSHYVQPLGMEGMTEAARQFALRKSFLHWGISAWSSYAILGAALAYFSFRKNKRMVLSQMIEPVIGEKHANGVVGMVIDVFTIFATIAGVVTSLGLGTLQINGGLNYLFNIPSNIGVQLIIVGTITICFLSSAVLGLDKGIQKISNLNLLLGAVLFIVCFLVGPTFIILQNFGQGLLNYIPEVVRSLDPTVSGDWYQKWTLFHWSSWICWAPPVGVFIARISRGRTLKEFMIGVLLVPSIVCLLWFATFGTIGMESNPSVIVEAAKVTETAFFQVIMQYPLGGMISILTVVLLGTFFITSADSATFVLGMLSSKGDLNPTNKRKLILGSMISILTMIFLAAGGVTLVQNISTIAAFPFAMIMIVCIVSFFKVLKTEAIDQKESVRQGQTQRSHTSYI